MSDNETEYETLEEAEVRFTPNAARALRAKCGMSMDEALAYVDEHGIGGSFQKVHDDNPPAPREPQKPKIYFTGFMPWEKEELMQLAKDHGMYALKKYSKTVMYLCYGDEPGPKTVERAKERGIPIVSVEELKKLWATGELGNAQAEEQEPRSDAPEALEDKHFEPRSYVLDVRAAKHIKPTATNYYEPIAPYVAATNYGYFGRAGVLSCGVAVAVIATILDHAFN